MVSCVLISVICKSFFPCSECRSGWNKVIRTEELYVKERTSITRRHPYRFLCSEKTEENKYYSNGMIQSTHRACLLVSRQRWFWSLLADERTSSTKFFQHVWKNSTDQASRKINLVGKHRCSRSWSSKRRSIVLFDLLAMVSIRTPRGLREILSWQSPSSPL